MEMWLTCSAGVGAETYQSCRTEENRVLRYARGHSLKVQVMEWHGQAVEARITKANSSNR